MVCSFLFKQLKEGFPVLMLYSLVASCWPSILAKQCKFWDNIYDMTCLGWSMLMGLKCVRLHSKFVSIFFICLTWIILSSWDVIKVMHIGIGIYMDTDLITQHWLGQRMNQHQEKRKKIKCCVMLCEECWLHYWYFSNSILLN